MKALALALASAACCSWFGGADGSAINRGYALSFQGDNPIAAIKKGVFDFADPGIADIDTEITVMFWGKIQDMGDDNRILFSWTSKADSNLFQPWHSADGLAFGRELHHDWTGSIYEWRHFAATVKNNVLTAYLDGVVTSVSAFTKNITLRDEETSMHFGSHLYTKYSSQATSYSSRAYRGKLDEVRIYSRALTAVEIQAAMFEIPQTTGLPSDLVMYYPFDFDFSPSNPTPQYATNYGSAGSDYDLILGGMSDDFGFGTYWIDASSSSQGDCAARFPFAIPTLTSSTAMENGTSADDNLDVPIVVFVAAGESVTIPLPEASLGSSLTIQSVPVNGTLAYAQDGITAGSALSVSDTVNLAGVTQDSAFILNVDMDFMEPMEFAFTDGSANEQKIHVYPYTAPELIQDKIDVNILEDSTTKIRSLLNSITSRGEDAHVVITQLPTKGTLYQLTSSGISAGVTDREQNIGEITANNTIVTNADGVIRYTPFTDGYGQPYDSFKLKVVSNATNLESSEMLVEITVVGTNDLPIANNGTWPVDEDSTGVLITLDGYDSESVAGLVITKLPTKGKLYLVDENGNKGELIEEPYSTFNVGNVMDQYADSVLSVSSFWGGPPYEGYAALNVLGPPTCFSVSGNTECRDERLSISDYVFSPRELIKFNRNYQSGGAKLAVLARITRHLEGSGSSARYDLKLHPMYKLVNGEFQECVLEGSSFPADCNEVTATNNGGSSEIEFNDVPFSALESLSAGVWSPLTKTYSGDSVMLGGEDAAAFGLEYNYNWTQEVGWKSNPRYTEYIEVSFMEPVYPVAVEIGSSRGAGGYVAIRAFGPDSKWHPMYVGNVKTEKYEEINTRKLYDKFSEDICRPFFATNKMRIEIDTFSVPDWNYIDYIKLLGSQDAQTAMLRYPNNRVMYVPDKNAYGEDKFYFTSTDCGGDRLRAANPAPIQIDIAPTEDDPIISFKLLHATSSENPIATNMVTGTVDIEVNFVEPDDQTTTFSFTQPPQGLGTVEQLSYEDNKLVLRFTKGKCDSLKRQDVPFKVFLEDSNSNMANATISVIVDCAHLPRIYNFSEMSEGASVTAFVLGLLGIVIAVVCLLFNVLFRKVPSVRLTSPNLNIITIIGCITIYGYLITFTNKVSTIPSCADETFWGMGRVRNDTNDVPDIQCADTGNHCCQDAVTGHCYVRMWLLALGIVMAFAPLYIKTQRISAIFTKKMKRTRRISDRELLVKVGLLTITVLLLLVIHMAMSPMSMEFTFGNLKIGDDQVVHVPIEGTCISEHQSAFTSILVVFFGFMMFYGAYLAWTTRNIEVQQANDSKQIGFSVYNIMTFGSLCLVLSQTIADPTALGYILAVVIWLCVTLTLVILFFFRMIDVVILGKTEISFSSNTQSANTSGKTTAVQPTATSDD